MPVNLGGLRKIRITVVSADGLIKRDVFRFPDPFAVITVDSEQTRTTSVIKKTLNPYWNEHFDVSVILFLDGPIFGSNFYDQPSVK
jgi:E3 ubiquitin-protein ligase NEDD4